jgi:hypothetical protein
MQKLQIIAVLFRRFFLYVYTIIPAGQRHVFLLTAALAVNLVTGSATPRTTYIITDGDVVTTVEGYAGELDGALERRASLSPLPTRSGPSARTGRPGGDCPPPHHL